MASPMIFCGKENKNDEHDQGQMNLEEVNPILTAWASEYVSPRGKFVACLSDPCKNGGIREEEGGIQRCRCPKYYAGKHCQYFCVDGSSQVMSTQQTRGEGSSSVFSPVLGQLHCGPSGYDSFWLDHSEGNFAVGLQGNSTPFIKFRPEVQVKINSVGLRVRGASGGDWMIDQPCGDRIRSYWL
ncbi:uncharacterized protein LOC121415146 isoform X2 [Lytechinus variegatus]|uniref:uncharacterized protein LOC121415146 isoform X2 n=1 Tax=Lytechinus variegatus TaxID=7654 RepID=UPI001BB1121B|nr:uncharacterized protein LOC121415146 isoform X2 [Lytechinus variegatus]